MADRAGKGQRRVLDGHDTAALRGRQFVHHGHDVPYWFFGQGILLFKTE